MYSIRIVRKMEASQKCSICLEKLDSAYSLDCGHHFHYDCLIKWFRSPDSNGTCPLCRQTPIDRLRPTSAFERYKFLRRKCNTSDSKLLKKHIDTLKKKEQKCKELKKEFREFKRKYAHLHKEYRKMQSTIRSFEWTIRKSKLSIGRRDYGIDVPAIMEIPDNVQYYEFLGTHSPLPSLMVQEI